MVVGILVLVIASGWTMAALWYGTSSVGGKIVSLVVAPIFAFGLLGVAFGPRELLVSRHFVAGHDPRR